MKKVLVFVFVVLMCLLPVSAQLSDNLLDVETSTIEKGKYAVTIEYTPFLLEARVYCSAQSTVFDEADAINSVMYAMEEFAGEKKIGDFHYFTRPAIREDKTKKITYYIVTGYFEKL